MLHDPQLSRSTGEEQNQSFCSMSSLFTDCRFVSLCVLCSHLSSEMTKARGELVSKESELQRLRRDVATKTSQVSRMDESLQHLKSQLDSKTDRGVFGSLTCVGFVLQRHPPLHCPNFLFPSPSCPLLSSGGSGGDAPPLRGRQAQPRPAGPDVGGAASGGAGRVV